MDDYGNELHTTAEWRDSMSRTMGEAMALIDVLQKQGDINSEEIMQVKAQVAENSAMTKEARDNSAELLEAFAVAKGGLRMLEFLAKIGKLFAMIGAGYAAYQKLRNGVWPFK